MSNELADAITAELRNNDQLDSSDIITHWVVLAAIHGADDDGEAPGTAGIRSDSDMPMRTELGLLEERKMFIQAVMTAAHLRDDVE